MNKRLSLLILPIIAFVAASCNENNGDPELTVLIRYLAGYWEVIEPDQSDRSTIYEISDDETNLPATGSVGYSGSLTTYYLAGDNPPRHDKEYTWKIVAVEDLYYPLIELVWQADIDGNAGDEPANRFYYRIEELTPTSMRWHIDSATGEETINFIRRTAPGNK